MIVKNTAEDYGSIAKWLHWTTAALFLGSYISVYYLQWFTEEGTPEDWIAIQLHLSIGITVAVVVMLRIIWRMSNRVPELEPGTKLEHLAAHAGHYALYAIMIIMPITGYMGSGINTEYFFLFDIPKFEGTRLSASLLGEGLGVSFEEFEDFVDSVHQASGKWIVWVLIVGHASAALYHHFIRRDRTLQKMTFSK